MKRAFTHWANLEATLDDSSMNLSLAVKSVRLHDTNSCLALHCKDTGHTISLQDTRILGSANSQRALEVVESLHS